MVGGPANSPFHLKCRQSGRRAAEKTTLNRIRLRILQTFLSLERENCQLPIDFGPVCVNFWLKIRCAQYCGSGLFGGVDLRMGVRFNPAKERLMTRGLGLAVGATIIGVLAIGTAASAAEIFVGSQTRILNYPNGSGNIDPQTSVSSNNGTTALTAEATSTGAGRDGVPVLGTAFAYGSLGSGILRSSSVTTTTFTPGFGGGNGIATAEAGFSDVLSFDVSGAAADTITPVTVTAHLDGVYGTPLYGGMSLFQLLVCSGSCGDIPYDGVTLGLIPNYNGRTVFEVENQPWAGAGSISNIVGGWISYDIRNQTVDGFDFSGVYGLRGPNPQVGVQVMLFTSASDGGLSDFSHTSKLGLALPQGLTYSSESGVFLSEAGVPEPTTWVLMLVGFGGLGAAARRSRRFQVIPAT